MLGILNSSYAGHYFKENVAILDNGGMQMRQQYVENIFIPKITGNNTDLVEQIEHNVSQLALTGRREMTLEQNIDRLVYQLYNLTPEEIAIIEQSTRV